MTATPVERGAGMPRGGEPSAASRDGSRVVALDGLRGVAIILVLISHVRDGLVVHGRVDGLVVRLMTMGWVGVDLFFVLSGYLITAILLESRGARGYYRTFYSRRTLRIFPLYYTFLAALFLTAAIRYSSSPDARIVLAGAGWYVAYLTNVWSVMRPTVALPWRTGPLWSLAIEEQFYLVWPALVARLSLRRLATLCLAAIILIPILRGGLLLAGDRHVLPRYAAETANFVLSPLRADVLLLGALLAIARRDRRWITVRRSVRWVLPTGVVAVALLAWETRGLSPVDHAVQQLGYTLIALCFACLVALASDRESRSHATAVLESRPLVSIGRYSYAIYILHLPVMALVDGVWPRSALPLIGGNIAPALALYAVSFTAVMWLVGRASFTLLESPFLRLRERFPYTRTATGSIRSP